MTFLGFVLFVSVFCDDRAHTREIVIKKNLYDIPLVVPDSFTDKNFTQALSLELDTVVELEYVKTQLFSLLPYTFGMNTFVYNPLSTGYYTGIGEIKPLTVYDPDSTTTHDSRGSLEGRVVAFVGYFVSFNSSGVFPGE